MKENEMATSMTRRMPSPQNTNLEGLFVRTRIMTRAGMAYDAAAKDDGDVLMQLRDKLEELLRGELSPEALQRFYKIFDNALPVRADDKRKTFDAEPLKAFLASKGLSEDDVEHILESLPRNAIGNNPGGALSARSQAMDSRERARDSRERASDDFARRHPEVARVFPGGA
jgi:hypothetical protein